MRSETHIFLKSDKYTEIVLKEPTDIKFIDNILHVYKKGEYCYMFPKENVLYAKDVRL